MKKINSLIKKISLIFLTSLALLVVIFFLIQKGVKELDSNRIALVDKIGKNYVFRGNNPLMIKDDKVVFAYDELTALLNKTLKKQGNKPLRDYYLIDINLLDWDQYSLIKKEENFFTQYPNRGEMINISTLSPSLLIGQLLPSNAVTDHFVNGYNLWITKTLEEIKNLAELQKDKPVVVYIHCDSGRDRTGLIVTSYRLLFKNMSLAQTRPLDLKEVGRSSMVSYDQAIRSYCQYVRKNYGKAGNYCTYANAPQQILN